MKVWKRNAVVACIVLFVCGAVYLNWSYAQKSDISADAVPTGKLLGGAALVGASAQPSQTPEASTESDSGESSGGDYFSNARINRQQARDSALSLLEQAAGSQDADQAMRDEANASIQVMAACTLAEAEIENLVTAKGYLDCVAFVGENSASVVVSLAEGDLTDTDTAKIMEIAMEQTGLAASQIKIIKAQ